MPSLRLTKRFIDDIPFHKRQVLYHDTDLTGFGLCVSSKTKTYFVQKCVNGRTVRTTLGRHNVLTPDQARREAIITLAEMAKGHNPNKIKRDKKVEIITFMQAFESRMAAKGERLREKTVQTYRWQVDKYLSDWKNRSLEDITKQMVIRRFNDVAKESGPNMATAVMRAFSVTYNYARYLNMALPENPVVILSLTKAWHTPQRRQRVITAESLAAWHEAVLAEPNEIMREYLQLLLFTGLRRMEAAQLLWKNVDFTNKTFTIQDTKNRNSHLLPLTKFTTELLQRRASSRINEYVFPGIGYPGHMQDPKKAIQRITDATGIEFSSHDLRRTFITTAESLDLSSYTIKYLINHRTNNDLTGGYMVLDINRMREPMRRIEEKLLGLIGHDKKGAENIKHPTESNAHYSIVATAV